MRTIFSGNSPTEATGGPTRPFAWPRGAALEPARRLWRALYEHAVFYLTLAVLGLVIAAWGVACFALGLVLPASLALRAGPAMVAGVARLYVGIMTLSGQVRFDLGELDALREDGPLVIAPNHPSMLDAVLVLSRLPRVACVTKASLWDNWVLGGGIRMAGYIRNDGPITLVRQAAGKLRLGRQLLLFPEGTRTAEPPVGPFRGGFAAIAKLADVPVQTVFIETSSPFLSKGWPLLRKPAFPLTYRARLGRRFEVSGSVREFVPALARYFEGELGAAGGLSAGPR